MDWPVRITLKRPIKLGDEEFSELEFDEPDLGTTIAADDASSEAEATVLTLAGMAGVSRDVILKIKRSDYEVIMEKIYPEAPEGEADVGSGEDAVGNAA